MTAYRWIGLGFAAALLAAVGCSSSDSGGTPSTPGLSCSDGGAAAANGVTMTCGGLTGTATEMVNVVMGGPASGTTSLRGLNFDVTYDPAKVAFVDDGTYTSPLFPGALVAVARFNNVEGRLVVSIQQLGTSPAVAVGSGQHTALSLSFTRAAGATFTATPLAFQNFDATSSTATISFSSSLALAYQ